MYRFNLNEFLNGTPGSPGTSATWVTSYTAFIHDLPQDENKLIGDPSERRDRARPPQLGAYYRMESPREGPQSSPLGPIVTWMQTDGYYVVASLLVLKFGPPSGGTADAPTGNLWGYLRVNRGGNRLLDTELTGDYYLFYSPFDVVEGDINLHIPSPPSKSGEPQPPIVVNNRWIAKTYNELEWWCRTQTVDGKPNRGVVSRGTLTRIQYERPEF